MKKIRFGSFPLISVSREDRDCIDKYSIKNYSDLITLNSAVKSSSDTIDKYITPYSIYKYFKNPALMESLSSGSGKDDDIRRPNVLRDKAESMQRAFRSLREISIGIQNIPFYSDKIAFPIYLEHKSNAKNDYDYDFLLLTNDLIDKQALDEIHYDDNVTMLFLVMKDIMYARTPLTNIGLSTSDAKEADVKRQFAEFLELCKQYDKNPIDIFVNIIKVIGKTKEKTGSLGGSLKERFTKQTSDSTHKKLSSLFSQGEIKDASFMLQAIKQKDIAEFLDETSVDNASTHNGVINRQQSVNSQMSPEALARQKETSTTITTQLEREYLLSKTHSYNEILSVVSSLINFNQNTKIIDEVSDGSLRFDIKTFDPSGITTGGLNISVNADAIIDKIRTFYFDTFVKSLINNANIMFNAFETEAKKALPKQVSNYLNQARKKEFEAMKGSKTDETLINDHYATIDNLKEDLKNALSIQDQAQVDAITAAIDAEYRSVDSIRNTIMLNNIVNLKNDKSHRNEDFATRKFRFEENIESIQGSLVALLNEIEATIYTKESLQYLITTFSNPANDPSVILNAFRTSLTMIASEIMISYENSFRNEVLDLYGYMNLDATSLETEVFDKLERSGKINTDLTDKMELSLKSLFTNIYRDFGSKFSQSKIVYTQGRAERNPIIKQTIMQSNNFKTFIISQKILLDLYDILSYIDGQKYISGLLRFPPSKVYGEIARMKYIVERLGLASNPVFIIDKLTRSVILSSPDMLSLTGTPLFNKITSEQMKAICYIDYNKDLWNSEKIMAHYTKSNNDQKSNNLKKEIQKLDESIGKLAKVKDMTPEQRKELDKLRADKVKKEEERARLGGNTSNNLSFSTSLTSQQNRDIKDMASIAQQNEQLQQAQSYQNSQPVQPQYQPQQNSYQNSQNVQDTQSYPEPNQQPYTPNQVRPSYPNNQSQQGGHMYPQITPRPQSWNNPYRKGY